MDSEKPRPLPQRRGTPTITNTTETTAQVATPSTPRCCERWGLIYPDGRRICWRHAEDERRALLLELDERAARRGLKRDSDGPHGPPHDRLWPRGADLYVAFREAMCTWAEDRQLRYAGTRCLDWVRRGRCGRWHCSRPPIGRWGDHPSAWTGPDGARVLVTQPYLPALGDDDARELEILRAEGMTVEVGTDCWYLAADCIIVVTYGGASS